MGASQTYWGSSELSTEELAEILSDYHKDVMGYRMHLWNAPREHIVAELNKLDDYMAMLRSTPEGRQQLRDEGWTAEEPQ